MRELMLLTKRIKIEFICKKDIFSIKYYPVAVVDEWKIGCLYDLLNIKQGNAVMEDFEPEEIMEMLEFICVS